MVGAAEIHAIFSGACAIYADASTTELRSSDRGEVDHSPKALPETDATGLPKGWSSRRGGVCHSSQEPELVHLCFEPNDAFGVQRARHNCDAESIKREGFWSASHTVIALEDTTSMMICMPEHIVLVSEASRRSTEEKARFLRSLPAYAHCSRRSLQNMAEVMVRKWVDAETPVVIEVRTILYHLRYRRITVLCQGGAPEDVFFTCSGQLRVVKNAGHPTRQKTVNGTYVHSQLSQEIALRSCWCRIVIGSGSCFGDLGVLNGVRPTSLHSGGGTLLAAVCYACANRFHARTPSSR